MDIEQRAIEIYALRTIEAEKLKLTEKQQLAKTTAHWYKQCERLQERIRELEARNEQLAEAIGEQVAIEELNARIAKAREILRDGWQDNNPLAMREALDALEGK